MVWQGYKNKISKIKDSSRNAEDWLSGTGSVCPKEGISIDDYMNSICIQYYDLKKSYNKLNRMESITRKVEKKKGKDKTK